MSVDLRWRVGSRRWEDGCAEEVEMGVEEEVEDGCAPQMENDLEGGVAEIWTSPSGGGAGEGRFMGSGFAPGGGWTLHWGRGEGIWVGLLFIATLSVILTTNPSTPHHDSVCIAPSSLNPFSPNYLFN
ncbi:hypothetical protein ACFX13_035250 [Malus domestica]